MKRVTQGGGWNAIRYAFDRARAVGFARMYRALASRNACKTCALGMGGQAGGMVDESGRFPEVCKKSIQAMAADMQGRIGDSFFRDTGIGTLRSLTPRELESLGRLATPVLAGPEDTHFRTIGWQEAIAFCVERLKRAAPDENFFYFSGRSSNEAGFLLQLFARVRGTNNVNNCSFYCHQASGAGLTDCVGTGTATVVLDDLRYCDTLFLIGGNPASNHPRLMRRLMEIRRRGGHVIVINPLRETGLVRFAVPSDWRSLLFGSPIASLYVQPMIGGDIPLLLGVAKHVFELGAESRGFLSTCCEGADAYRDYVAGLDWHTIESAAGVDRTTIERIAAVYAQSRAAIFAWTMGITHHQHGVDNVRAITGLAMVRGMVGRPHAGLLPVRGHSNVQGIGSVGVTPALKRAVFARLQSHFGIELPTTAGMDTLACIRAVQAGRLRHAWCLGGNLYGSSPDAKATARAFGRLESVVYLSTTMNTGHVWGRGRHTLILPVLARDEETQPTTQESMFNYVRLSEGGPRRLEGPRSEVEVIAAIACGVLGDEGPIDWRSMQEHRNVRAAISKVIPGYEAIGRIDDTGREFQIDGRTLHEYRFPTPSGKARFRMTPIPAIDLEDDELRLMTIRSEGQFNTVVYEEYDLYRQQDRRDVILMNRSDMDRRGLRQDQAVTVRSAAGAMSGIRVREAPIRAGNAAMYFPEANVLTPPIADGESGTPSFKMIAVRVQAGGTANGRE
ncbi:MAG: histidine kinase [Phycisphaerales bacterium]|nr:MAG: histidine kinase [Phycisphaerales bacterium]